MRRALALAAALLAAPALAQSPCGLVDAACDVPLGAYRLALPEAPPPETGHPAVLFFHGAGASSAQALDNPDIAGALLARGWAVIAPEGSERTGAPGRGWSFLPGRPAIRDEDAFARQVIDDAVAHNDIDRDRVLLAGFSIGGSLTWYLACADPGLAAAYAPVAGAFWRPHPEMDGCAGPVRLLHTHGWRDGTVPIEGRPLRGGALKQGDLFHGLEILRATNGCAQMKADGFDTSGPFWRRWWTACTPGSALELALHQGGHVVPPGWADLAIDWFEQTVPAGPPGKTP